MEETRRRHPSVADAIADARWLNNDLDEYDRFILCTFATVNETAVAEAILQNMIRPGATEISPKVKDSLPSCSTGATQMMPASFPWSEDGLNEIEVEAMGLLRGNEAQAPLGGRRHRR